MSEYVIEIPDYVLPFEPFASAAKLGEEIIRCRDCKYNDEVINACDHPWITPLYGDVPLNYILSTAPDGFCAWGKRIVRCKDCVSSYRDEDGMWCCFHGTGFYRKPTDEDNYCSKGKRRDA